MAFVNAQESLSTEDLFKTLLVYYKPDQGLFATRRDPQFLAAAINKESSQGSVSEETQRNIAAAMYSGRFGNRTIPEAVAIAIAAKLDAFTDPEAQRNISAAIRDGKFGTNPAVLAAVAGKLSMFTHKDAQLQIALAISKGRFGKDPAVLAAVAGQLAIFREPAAQLLIAVAISNGAFGKDTEVLKVLAEHLPVFTDGTAKRTLSAAICQGRIGVDAGVLKTLYRRDMVSFKALMTGSTGVQTALYREFKFEFTPPLGISETDL